MEMVRSVKVTVEVDTNKRTIRKEYGTITEAMENADDDFGDLVNHVVHDEEGCDDD